MSIIDFIYSLWQSFTDLFLFSKKSLTNRLNVYIKSTKGDTVNVDLDPKWDIEKVKEVVAPKLGLPPGNMELILAGKVLDDSIIIEECDLGEKSILHAVLNKNRSGSKPLNQTLSNLEEEAPVNSSPIQVKSSSAHFFVFCRICDNVHGKLTEGKLRVRCRTCRSGAITVDSDPASWADVIQPQRISGHCEQEGCPDGAVAWAEFYFKCSEHKATSKQEQEAISLPLVRPNSWDVPCLACTEVITPVLVFPCADGHVICIPCFNRYCISRLGERRFVLDKEIGYTLPCPVGCANSLISDAHHFLLLPQKVYSQYQQFGAEDYVLKNNGVLCPRPDCGTGIFPDPDCNSVKCPCGYVFCKKCLEGNHTGECDEVTSQFAGNSSHYEVDPKKAAQSRWDEASKTVIKMKTKPCPKCRTATERAGGCMHMVCLRCDFEWCWVCQTGWTRDCMGSHWFG